VGDVRRDFVQRLSAALHGTRGSYLHDTLQGAVLMLWYDFLFIGLRFFLFSSLFRLVVSATFSCIKNIYKLDQRSHKVVVGSFRG
jgi:hypothetical protein